MQVPVKRQTETPSSCKQSMAPVHLTLSPSKCPRLLWRVLKGSIVVTSSSPRVSPAGISASTKAGALKSFGLTCEKGLRERGREREKGRMKQRE